MTAFLRRYPLAVLLCVSAVMLVSHLGMIQTNIMEARNLITAREMVKDGHWIFTTIDGMPRYEKPPLPTWLTAFFGYSVSLQKHVRASSAGCNCVFNVRILFLRADEKVSTQKQSTLACFAYTHHVVLYFFCRKG
jgi:hypothetical protein